MRSLAAMAIALTPFPALAGDFSSLLDSYVDICGQALLAPGETREAMDLGNKPADQVSWSEDRKLVSFTEGAAQDYTIILFSNLGGKEGSTCSRSISEADVTAEEIDGYLRGIPGGLVSGGLYPLIYVDHNGSFASVDDTHTWLVALPQWQNKGVSFHVQLQSETVTMTAFGGLTNLN